MTPCDAYRVDLAAHIYGELASNEERALQAHLESCAACRDELRALQRTVTRLTVQAAFPHEDQVDWQAFARATVRRATGYKVASRAAASTSAAGVRGWWKQLRLAPAWSAAAAAFLLLAGASLGTWGVLTLRGPAPAPTLVAEVPAALQAHLPKAMLSNIEDTSAREGTRRYLAESRALLVSLLATPVHCQKDTIDIRDERAKSLELLRRQRLIADDLERLPLARARDVCRDLERLLVEIASMNDCAKSEQIRELKDLVESRQLLLRLELVSDEMRTGAARDV